MWTEVSFSDGILKFRKTHFSFERVKPKMLNLKQLNLNIYLIKLSYNLLLKKILLIMMTK